jgi:hypothetical protein
MVQNRERQPHNQLRLFVLCEARWSRLSGPPLSRRHDETSNSVRCTMVTVHCALHSAAQGIEYEYRERLVEPKVLSTNIHTHLDYFLQEVRHHCPWLRMHPTGNVHSLPQVPITF